MKLRTVCDAGRPKPWRRRTLAEGGMPVACASVMPLIVLALAIAADYANVARFRTHVQLAADAAALAATGLVARHPVGADGRDVDALAEEAAAVFALNAPRGAAAAPTVETRRRASLVTTTVGYEGVAPSSFGSALGYGAIGVSASATSNALVADSRRAAAP
jgi:uncharacterized membrane protein